MNSQTTDITGFYQLSGVMETASGFHFKPDSTFAFYVSYGASDRQATGTYTFNNGQVILKGDKTPGKDFMVSNSSKKGNYFTLKVVHKNQIFTQDIICIMKEGEVVYTDEKGQYAASEKPDSIQFIHPFFPDEPTIIRMADFPKDHNYFEITLQPQLEQVCFLDTAIEMKDGKFSLKLPWVFGKKEVTFYKEEDGEDG